MLAKSKKEGEEERVIYAKFKCYCDSNEAEKRDAIKTEGENINSFKGKLAELKGKNGRLSQEVMKLETDMKENKATREMAKNLREAGNKNFKQEKEDMESAIKGFKDAMEVL